MPAGFPEACKDKSAKTWRRFQICGIIFNLLNAGLFNKSELMISYLCQQLGAFVYESERPSLLTERFLLGVNMLDIPPYQCFIEKISGEQYVNVREVFLKKLLTSAIDAVEVDEIWYREKYPDIDEAIKDGQIKNAKEHYTKSGYFEGRLPRKIVVDSAWYLSAYRDVAETIKMGKMRSAQEHFDENGFIEGRLAAAGWHL